MYKQLDRSQKLIQLDNTAEIVINMLKRESFLAHSKGIVFNDMNEIIDYINTEIDVRPYFNIEYSKNFSCIRRSCIQIHSANFFKGANNITMYHCNDCNVLKSTTTLYTVVMEAIGMQLKTYDASTINSYIRSLFDVCFVSEFYQELEDMTQNNVKILKKISRKGNLRKLLNNRNLFEFYEEFILLSSIYMREDEPLKYAFYLSQSQIKKQYEYKLGKKASNYTVAKVNMLVALGLIDRVNEDKLGARLRKKVQQRKEETVKDKHIIKSTNVYQLVHLTPEILAKAEEVAKVILEEKMQDVSKAKVEELIKVSNANLKKQERFIKEAKSVIRKEVRAKGFIQYRKIVGKIDTKARYYKKQEKEELLESTFRRIKSETNIDLIIVDKAIRERFGLKRSVKNGEEILIKKEEKIEKKKINDEREIEVERYEIMNGEEIRYVIDEIDHTDTPDFG